ncbi:MAG: hypothetical protein SX243_11890 [Acidobacteriota bacterium]|nr:hypothetical protein [Acidobacteriota bacterium]
MFVLAVLAVGGILGALVAELRLRRGEAAMGQEWRRLLDAESFEAAFPTHSTNETALEVEASARALGIDFFQPAGLDLSPDAVAETRWRRASPAIHEFLGQLLKAPSRNAWPELEPAASSYLRWAQPRLLQLARDLEEGPPLQFHRDLADPSQPVAGGIGLYQLQKVLAAAAALALQEDRPQTAERLLEAAWELATAIRREPQVVHQLISLAMLQRQLAVLRGHCSPSPRWLHRLQVTELRPPLRVALEAQTYYFASLARWDGPVESLIDTQFSLDPNSDLPGYESFHQPLLRPLIRWSLRDTAVRYHRHLQRLDRIEPRDFDAGAACRDLAQSIPRWQLVGQIVTSCLAEVWTRALSRELHLELTEKVLQERLHPVDQDYRLESNAVPGLFWLRESQPDEVVIRLENGLPHPPANEPDLLYRLTPSDCP